MGAIKKSTAENTEPEIEGNIDAGAPAVPTPEQVEELDADEAEFCAIRQDLPGVKGVSAAGIVSIAVGKMVSPKHEYFRTHPEFRPLIPVVDTEVGIEKQFFAVTPDMVANLASIGITVSNHVLYLTTTPRGGIRIIPVRQASGDFEQDEYSRTKELGLVQGVGEWVRLYSDQENRVYKVFPAPPGRFADPHWPELKDSKIFRLAFKDKGRLIDSTEHPLFQKWAGRDAAE